MNEAGKTHHCGECIYFKQDPGIHRMNLAKKFVDTHCKEKGKIIPPKEHRSMLYDILSKKWTGGIKTCVENQQIIEASFKICEYEDKFSPRKNLSYWFSRLKSLTL